VGTYTATTINARFRINGRSVFLFMYITVNNKGTATGNPIATLPISAIYSNLFICYGRENALEGKMLQGHISTPTTMTIFDYANAPPNNSNGAVYIVNVTYMI
jgi:hypothetical protein